MRSERERKSAESFIRLRKRWEELLSSSIRANGENITVLYISVLQECRGSFSSLASRYFGLNPSLHIYHLHYECQVKPESSTAKFIHMGGCWPGQVSLLVLIQGISVETVLARKPLLTAVWIMTCKGSPICSTVSRPEDGILKCYFYLLFSSKLHYQTYSHYPICQRQKQH